MTDSSTETLAKLVRQKRQLLEQLIVIAERQAVLVKNGEMAELIRMIAGKQQLINALQSIERGLNPFRGQDPESRVWKSPADRAACAQDSNACGELVQKLFAMEQESEKTLTERRDVVSDQLRKTRSTKHAVNAYQQAPGGPHTKAQPPSVLDMTSER